MDPNKDGCIGAEDFVGVLTKIFVSGIDDKLRLTFNM